MKRMADKDSDKAEEVAYDIFRARGYRVFQIANRLDSGEERDEGDLLIYKYAPEPNSHQIRTVRVVDVKCSLVWDGAEWPFDIIMLTDFTLHPDWMYLVLSKTHTTGMMVDMREVPLDEVVTKKSKNHSLEGEWDTKAVPAKYGKRFDVDAILYPK